MKNKTKLKLVTKRTNDILIQWRFKSLPICVIPGFNTLPYPSPQFRHIILYDVVPY